MFLFRLGDRNETNVGSPCKVKGERSENTSMSNRCRNLAAAAGRRSSRLGLPGSLTDTVGNRMNQDKNVVG